LEVEKRKEAVKSREVVAVSFLKLADSLNKISDNNNSSEILLAATNQKINGVEEKVKKCTG
jgi:hypothetical protein